MKILVVGEAPSKGMREGDPPLLIVRNELAQMCGLNLADFLERFDLTNLLSTWPGAWPIDTALRAAMKLAPILGMYDQVIFLGRRVEDAFFRDDRPWFKWEQRGVPSLVAVCPNEDRWFNIMENRLAARDFWRRTAEVQLGTA